MLLSHYTSELGLIGLTRSQSFWATNFLSLNDTSEYTYALSEIFAEAFQRAHRLLPDDLKNPDAHSKLSDLISQQISSLKSEVEASDGYGALYVTSFARGRNDDEDHRGIMTIWDRYTKHEGYCLQYSRERIKQLIEFERQRWSYAYIDLVDVIYGVDRNGAEFGKVVGIISSFMLAQAYRQSGHRQLEQYLEKAPTAQMLAFEMLKFCGKHKDPAFGDEREVRIMAYPASKAALRAFTGIASTKTIYRRGDGASEARYIVIGEHVIPGATPNRIIIGPKANLTVHQLVSLFPHMPAIEKSTLPIR